MKKSTLHSWRRTPSNADPLPGVPPIRQDANSGEIAFQDRNISTLGNEVRYGVLADADVAVVGALAAGKDWLIPTTSIGHTPACVESADRLIVEVNIEIPHAVERFHDFYRPGRPPN